MKTKDEYVAEAKQTMKSSQPLIGIPLILILFATVSGSSHRYAISRGRSSR